MDLGRLHDDRRVPVLGVGEPVRRDPRASCLPSSSTTCATRSRSPSTRTTASMTYYADLERSDHPGVASSVPGAVHRHDRRRPRSCAPTSAIRRTCSRCRRRSTRTITCTDPEVFYQKQDRWEIAVDPTQQDVPVQGTTTTSSLDDRASVAPLLPADAGAGEAEEAFQLVLPFVPEGRQNMVAWLAASSDPETYGRLLSLDLPASENVPGPSIVFSRINQDPQFSQERTLLGQSGSDRALRRSARDPDRELVPVRAAGVRASRISRRPSPS